MTKLYPSGLYLPMITIGQISDLAELLGNSHAGIVAAAIEDYYQAVNNATEQPVAIENPVDDTGDVNPDSVEIEPVFHAKSVGSGDSLDIEIAGLASGLIAVGNAIDTVLAMLYKNEKGRI